MTASDSCGTLPGMGERKNKWTPEDVADAAKGAALLLLIFGALLLVLILPLVYGDGTGRLPWDPGITLE